MNKRFTAKIQNIKPSIESSSNIVSDNIVVIPESADLKARKGSVFATFCIKSEIPNDSKLITKIITDILNETYYQSENISPIQSIERALSDITEKILNLPSEQIRSLSGGVKKEVSIDILTAVLWGNVIYIVQYGEGKVYLIRDGFPKTIETLNEGNFSAASGFIKEDDVVALCTPKFAELVPLEKFLSQPLLGADLPPDASSLVLKFIEEVTFSEKETIKFYDEKAVKKKSAPQLFKIDKTGILKFLKKQRFKLFVGSIVLLMVASIQTTLTSKSEDSGIKDENVMGESTQQLTEETSQIETLPEVDTSKDAETKTIRVKDPPIYNIKITEPTAETSEIAVLDDNVIVSDNSSGKLYISTINTPKYEKYSTSFDGINSLSYDDGNLSFSDKEGYKVYSIVIDKVLESYSKEGLNKTATYLDFVYSLEDGKIIKYTKVKNELSPSLWAQSEEFTDAKSLSVATSIYVITGDGNVMKHTRGIKDDFEIKGLDAPLKRAAEVVAYYNFDNIYIADPENKRIIVINENGELIKQLKHINPEHWQNIKDISVDPEEEKLFVLDGSKVFEVNL